MASSDDRRVAQSWITLGRAAEMPLTSGAIDFIYDSFHDEILKVSGKKFNVLKRVIGFAGAKARHCAKQRGSERVNEEDIRAAVSEVSAVMKELDPHFISICYCVEK